MTKVLQYVTQGFKRYWELSFEYQGEKGSTDELGSYAKLECFIFAWYNACIRLPKFALKFWFFFQILLP